MNSLILDRQKLMPLSRCHPFVLSKQKASKQANSISLFPESNRRINLDFWASICALRRVKVKDLAVEIKYCGKPLNESHFNAQLKKKIFKLRKLIVNHLSVILMKYVHKIPSLFAIKRNFSYLFIMIAHFYNPRNHCNQKQTNSSDLKEELKIKCSIYQTHYIFSFCVRYLRCWWFPIAIKNADHARSKGFILASVFWLARRFGLWLTYPNPIRIHFHFRSCDTLNGPMQM